MKPTIIYELGVFDTDQMPHSDELFVAALDRRGDKYLLINRGDHHKHEFGLKVREIMDTNCLSLCKQPSSNRLC